MSRYGNYPNPSYAPNTAVRLKETFGLLVAPIAKK
jgi:hypothetical protein